jgi:predicted nuclease with TOPRIM domain
MGGSETREATAALVRLGQLRAELERGRQRLAELEREHAEVGSTLLRIEGAILVLEELTTPATEPVPLAETA